MARSSSSGCIELESNSNTISRRFLRSIGSAFAGAALGGFGVPPRASRLPACRIGCTGSAGGSAGTRLGWHFLEVEGGDRLRLVVLDEVKSSRFRLRTMLPLPSRTTTLT